MNSKHFDKTGKNKFYEDLVFFLPLPQILFLIMFKNWQVSLDSFSPLSNSNLASLMMGRIVRMKDSN